MFKTRIRIHSLEVYDQRNLETVLNMAANDGWNLVSINRVYSVFRKNGKPRKYYYVLHNYSNYSISLFHKLADEEKKIREYLEEFGYNRFATLRLFEIYQSDSDIPVYTDDSLNEEKEKFRKKKIKKSFNMEALFFVLLVVSLIAINLKGSFYDQMSDTIRLIEYVAVWLVSFTVLPVMLYYKIIYLKNGTIPKRAEWTSYKNKPFQVYTVVILVIFFGLRLYTVFSLPQVGGSGYFEVKSVAELKEELTVSLENIPYIETMITDELNASGVIQGSERNSILLEELDLNVNEGITIVKSKYMFFSNIIFNNYLKKNRITVSSLENDKKLMAEKKYMYRYENYMVVSVNILDEQLINDVKQIAEKGR